ncbi:type II toxin-antitoxin system RelE/ParE family toxin [Pantoea vagans]|uniref:type II toxin-antitoxin system RelE/ParE family toxin n=1 Tax=Pantoea vagans TaxID=470934 RepID=UPI002251D2CC|nr:type II toxin-antitoxin system RelE/ParE family toxin [Pantoea vagans]MCX3309549.1 type II toxin-antitoxin system RelE/ParE family toxin [Pantoea vagans]
MRVFKTKWFSKAAKSHAIQDSELCRTIEAVVQGKADDPGGGIYKKRLNQNRDLAGFRELAKHYAALSDEKNTALIKNKELVEICHDCKK